MMRPGKARARKASCLSASWPLLVLALAAAGCQLAEKKSSLPNQQRVVRDQLIVVSDFYVPRRHRLLDELVARRTDISDSLQLPTSDEPIHVFLFDDSDGYRRYMFEQHPDFPDRRAFFVKNDTTLKVYAFWGDRVGEDLRHEVTHGYLHAVVPNIPLWLDEGLAEYFETPRGTHGFNAPHVYLLAGKFRRGDWAPSLKRLEQIEHAAALEQFDYAEAWLWVHWLLESNEDRKFLLQHQLAMLRLSGEAEPLSTRIEQAIPDANERLIEHLKSLADDL